MLKKTPLGQVLGLGSAKSGTEHWWHQRVSAIAGIPLVLFLIGFILGGRAARDAFAAELKRREERASRKSTGT